MGYPARYGIGEGLFKFMGDSTTKPLALQTGDIDMVDSITTAHDLRLLRKSPDFHVSDPLSTRDAFSYIKHQGVLAHNPLREAILLAIMVVNQQFDLAICS